MEFIHSFLQPMVTLVPLSQGLTRYEDINTTYNDQIDGLIGEREIKSSHSGRKVLGTCEQNPEVKIASCTLYFLCQTGLSFLLWEVLAQKR